MYVHWPFVNAVRTKDLLFFHLFSQRSFSKPQWLPHTRVSLFLTHLIIINFDPSQHRTRSNLSQFLRLRKFLVVHRAEQLCFKWKPYGGINIHKRSIFVGTLSKDKTIFESRGCCSDTGKVEPKFLDRSATLPCCRAKIFRLENVRKLTWKRSCILGDQMILRKKVAQKYNPTNIFLGGGAVF
jgi:hypothetical protein